MSVFNYRKPTEEEVLKMEELQKRFVAIEKAAQDLDDWAKNLEITITNLVPAGLERDRALTRLRFFQQEYRVGQGPVSHDQTMSHLQETRMWANAGIVLNRGEA